MGDEARAKGETGKKPRPKRDRNEPLPKPKKGGALKLLVGGLLLVVVAVVGVWVWQYSEKIGKDPTQWSAEDLSGAVDYSKQQLDEATAQVDWEALKGQITEKTKELWDKASGLEDQLDKKLASMRGARGETEPAPPAGEETTSTSADAGSHEPTSSGSSGTSGSSGSSSSGTSASSGSSTPKPTPGESTEKPAATGATPTDKPVAASAKPVKLPPTELERGVADLRDAMKLYRASMKSQPKLKAAREKFEKAQGHLEKARKDAKSDAEAQEIDDLLTECTTYLVDCRKRQTLR